MAANRFFGNLPGLLQRSLIVRAGVTLDITRLKSLILKVIKLKPREVCQVTQGQNELIQIYCSLGNCAPSLSRGRGWPCVCVSVCVCFVCVFTLHHPLWMLGDKSVASHWQGSCSPQAFSSCRNQSCDDPAGGGQATQRAHEASGAPQTASTPSLGLAECNLGPHWEKQCGLGPHPEDAWPRLPVSPLF